MPECHIIAGPNGAGKTTFAREFIPNYVDCLNFINPDLIAAGLSPFDASLAMSKAGRLVIGEIRDRATRGESFGFETTLSGRLYARTIDMLRARRYRVCLYYLWVPDPALAMMRIHERVRQGGHDVPEVDVRRRFPRSLWNLFHLYRQRVDVLHLFNNAAAEPQLVFREMDSVLTVYTPALYEMILKDVKR